jgi:hypothetical protein
MSDNWQGDERRNSQFNVKGQLMKAIDAENDAKMRNTYMLVAGNDSDFWGDE